jgi:hypothetical protein
MFGLDHGPSARRLKMNDPKPCFATLIELEGDQVVLIPEELEMSSTRVTIRREGDAVVITPLPSFWSLLRRWFKGA